MANRPADKKFVQLLLLFAVTLLVSCGGGGSNSNSETTPPPKPTLQSITVSSQNASVAAGLTDQFSAIGNYSDGSSGALSNLNWSTSDATVATVNSAGLVSTLKQGTVTVTAASGTVSNGAPLLVGPAIPTSLSVTPTKSSVIIGAATPTKLSAILTYSDNSTADVSSTATWSVTNPFTASVDTSGNVTPLRIGYDIINAASGTFTATSVFVVTAQPRYLYFMSNSGRVASKAVIEPTSGQLRMQGYIPVGTNESPAFPCPTTNPTQDVLYVGASIDNGGLSGEIQTYNLTPTTGTLTPLSGSPFAQPYPLQCLDFEPTGKFAYAADSVNGSTNLLTYSADAQTGALTLLNNMNLPGGPTGAAVDPIGKYLYVAVFSSDLSTASALGFSIDSTTGALTPTPGTPFTLSKFTGTFSFHPSGNFLYMANSNGSSIDTYSVDRSSGKLTATSTIATCISPSAIQFSPDGSFAYTTCIVDAAHDSNSPSVESFAVGSDGSLTHIGSVPSAGVPLYLTFDPSGQFLYLTGDSQHIQVFQVGSDGTARFVRKFGVPPSTAAVLALGGTSTVQYTPKTAYVTSTGDNTFSTYAANSDGTLTPDQSFSTQTPFSSLSLWPWGTDIATASAVPSPNLLAFPLSATGIPGSAFSFGNASTAGGVAIDPSGQFAFETDSTHGVIYTYSKTGGSWVLLTYLSTPPVTSFNAAAGAGPIAIDPSGLLVYVGNQVANSISAYQYWGTSPELVEATGQFVAPYTDGSPFPIGAAPVSLAVDPNETFLYVLCGDRTLRSFAIDYDSGGHIAQAGNVSLVGLPSGLTVEPTGRFIYTSDSTGVSAFTADSQTGAFTSVSLNPAITLANITGVYAEPAGQYLYVTTGAPNIQGAVFAYSIASNGNLTLVSSQPVATPLLPSSMAFADDIQ